MKYTKSQAYSGDPLIRAGVAKITASKELLDLYLYDPDPHVRRALTMNPHTTGEMGSILLSDRCDWVRNAAYSMWGVKDDAKSPEG